MELRKKKEIEYYDKQSAEFSGGLTSADFEGFNPNLLSSFKFLYKILEENCKGKIVLDYGCGNGIHSVSLAKMGADKVVGIDLSEPSLKIARQRAKQEGVGNKTEFVAMDCEKMEFPDNYFDVIFDGGTFSSIDLNKALPELRRVLKQDGIIIGIETLGHNPLTNFKRQINKITGRRTGWAADHILKMGDLETIKRYFIKTDIYFFHPVSWLAIPFVNLPGGRFLLKSLEGVDKFLLFVFPFFKKYSFKIVFVFYGKKVI